MNEDGTGQTRLTWNGKGDRAPRITPDGKKIVYWSLASGNPDIWVINSDGTNNTQLTRSPYMDIYPQWSPDGKKIIFESDRAGNFDIWLLSLDQPLTMEVEFETCAAKGETAKAFITVGVPVGQGAIRLESIGLRFDWERTGDYLEPPSLLPTAISGPSNPLRIPIQFKVPDDAASGYHFYDVKVQYSTVDASGSDLRMTYEYSGGDLEVDTHEHRQCDLLFIELGGKLDALHRRVIDESAQLGLTTSEVALPLKGYFDYLLKPEARPFHESNREFHEATRLYLAGDYPSALAHFENVKAQINRQSIEKSRDQNVIEKQVLLAFIPLIFIIAPLAVYLRRRNRLTRKS
jgi:hypothetical protein